MIHPLYTIKGLTKPANARNVNVENLSMVVESLHGGKDKFAVYLHNVLTKQECQNFIQRSEDQGFEPAQVNMGGGRQISADHIRNNDRAIIDDPAFAEVLFQRSVACLQDHSDLKDRLLDWNGEGKHHAVGNNERLRVLRYDPGTFFKAHSDGAYLRGGEAGERRRRERSKVTFQLYLNEGFVGGATRFIDRLDRTQGYDIIPRTGSVLLFEHGIFHEGSLLEEGRKYNMRTDVMYTTKGTGNEYSHGLLFKDNLN